MESEFRPPFNWRDHLKVHPAADLFPLMSEAELKELAEDIRKNGLQQAIVILRDNNTCPFKDYLIDGHNRLDALAMLGWLGPKRGRLRRESHLAYEHALPLTITYPEDVPTNPGKDILVRYDLENDDDVRECVVALNLHRRHLTAEQKRDVIAKLLKRDPEASDRKIAKSVNVDNKTVAKVRADLERREEIPHVETRADSKGRKQPSKKTERDKHPTTTPSDDAKKRKARAASADARKAHYADAETITIEDDLEPSEYRQAFLLRAADTLAFAVYSGPVDAEVVAAAERAASRWKTLADKMAAEIAADSAEAAPLIHDDLSIPEFLRREKHAGKAVA
jgi:hypothetical protein